MDLANWHFGCTLSGHCTAIPKSDVMSMPDLHMETSGAQNA